MSFAISIPHFRDIHRSDFLFVEYIDRRIEKSYSQHLFSFFFSETNKVFQRSLVEAHFVTPPAHVQIDKFRSSFGRGEIRQESPFESFAFDRSTRTRAMARGKTKRPDKGPNLFLEFLLSDTLSEPPCCSPSSQRRMIYFHWYHATRVAL